MTFQLFHHHGWSFLLSCLSEKNLIIYTVCRALFGLSIFIDPFWHWCQCHTVLIIISLYNKAWNQVIADLQLYFSFKLLFWLSFLNFLINLQMNLLILSKNLIGVACNLKYFEIFGNWGNCVLSGIFHGHFYCLA